MATLVVPGFDSEAPWPSLGPSVCDFIQERFIFGPGSLEGEPAVLDVDKTAIIHALYEVYPQNHEWAGRRRFKRGGYSVRKGLAKTELAAWLIELELHPESPVRCDGFDAYGRPVGRPVKAPYIPILSVTVEQVEELAYGALMYIVSEGPDADLFDVSNERIMRLTPNGGNGGVAVPVSNSPGSRDGARTTFQAIDEPHRLILPRQKKAVQTMRANLPKRPLEDAWELYVGTAGEPGEKSVQEDLHAEAEAIAAGKIEEPRLFYFHRWAGGTYDLTDKKQRIEAVAEATGPVGEYGPGQFDDIASQWDQPNVDTNYLERVWLNRWTRSNEQAFDPNRRKELLKPGTLPKGSFVTAGFDGARFRDSTAIVITDIPSGRQELWACWERPLDIPDDEHWEIDEDEVTTSVEQLMRTHSVWRFNADPPHWTETLGSWAGRWPCVEEWWTIRKGPMARAIKSYVEALSSGAVSFSKDHPNDKTFRDHYAAAGKRYINLWDEDEHVAGEEPRRLWILQKLHPDRKFDAQMAAVLSWEARLAALKANAQRPRRKKKAAIGRIR